MPDSGIADGATFSSAFWDSYVREQVCVTCTSSTRPTNVEGRLIYETNTDRVLLGTGSGTNWIILAEPVQSHTPTVTTTIGAITTVGATSFNYYRHNGLCFWRASIAITTNGTGAGAVRITLPFVPLNDGDIIGTGRERNSTGKLCSVTGNAPGGTADVLTYDNAYPGGSGYALRLSGCFQLPTRYTTF